MASPDQLASRVFAVHGIGAVVATDITLANPWSEFLREIDRSLSQEVSLCCAGGFALVALYGIPRYTGDLDYINVTPRQAATELEEIAGRNSALARRYGLSLQAIGGIVDLPENYDSRVQELNLGLKRLDLQILEAYDLLLSKLCRNSPKDQEDAKYVIQKLKLEFAVFYARWQQEMAPWIANRNRHELTIQLWKEYFVR